METDTKIFFILLTGALIGSVLVLPYTLTLQGMTWEQLPPIYMLLISQLLNTLIIFGILIFLGLKLARRIGWGLPFLECWLEKKEYPLPIKAVMGISVLMGVVAGVLIILFSQIFNFLDPKMALQFAVVSPPPWQGFLASFYGGINEEILLRLFFMTLLVWLFYRKKGSPEGQPTSKIYLAIILSSVVFGLGHLPVTASITSITPLVITRAVVLNGIGGLIFGYLYWIKGLESAMVAHFSADIVLHVIVPLISL